MGKFFEGLKPPLGDQTITVDLPTSIVFCIMVLFFFHLWYHILRGLFFWYIGNEGIEQEDDEPGFSSGFPSELIQMFETLVETSLQAWRMVGQLERELEMKRGQKLRDSKKLPPLFCYGSHGDVGRGCADCAICLEDFKVGDLCQVFPECGHIFHSDCLDSWLQRKLTCPICRRFVKDYELFL